MSDALTCLIEIGHCLDRLAEVKDGLTKLPTSFDKLCFIVVNTTSVFRQKLGFSPLNDSLRFGRSLHKLGYSIYFLSAPVRVDFINVFEICLRSTETHLVLFYSGHGNAHQHTLTNNWTVPGSAYHPMHFEDGDLDDNDIISRLESVRRPGLRMTLGEDCCEPESIWSIGRGQIYGVKVPPDVVSLSATIDDDFFDTVPSFSLSAISRPRPQPGEEAKGQGMFSEEVRTWRTKKSQINGNELSYSMRKGLKAHGQTVVIGTSTPELVIRPLFA
jgi:hypothetical protein